MVDAEGAALPAVPVLADIEATIQAFVRELLLDQGWVGGDPLAEEEFDSLALEQLLDHLEETYRILFTPEDIARQNLASVGIAAGMVRARILAIASGDRPW